MLIHVVDVSGIEGRDPIEDFERINKELELFNPKLASRKQIIAANKIDLLGDMIVYREFEKEMIERGYVVFPISAATKSGIKELMFYVTEALDKIDDSVLEDIDTEHKIYNMEKEADKDDRRGLEKLAYSTNLEDIDSLRRFQNILKKKGIFEELKEMGIKDGDTVKIFDVEFEYYE